MRRRIHWNGTWPIGAAGGAPRRSAAGTVNASTGTCGFSPTLSYFMSKILVPLIVMRRNAVGQKGGDGVTAIHVQVQEIADHDFAAGGVFVGNNFSVFGPFAVSSRAVPFDTAEPARAVIGLREGRHAPIGLVRIV